MDRLSQALKSEVGSGAKVLADRLGLHTVGDLLRYLPRKYLQRGELTPLNQAQPGDLITAVAQIVSVEKRPMRSRSGHLIQCEITDGSAQMSVTFFARRAAMVHVLMKQLVVGDTAVFAGKVDTYRGKAQLSHPEIESLDDLSDANPSGMVPVYPAVATVSSLKIRRAVATVLATLSDDDVHDPLPEHIRTRRGLLTLVDAFRLVHQPRDVQDYRQARKRLRFDEALILQTALARRRAEMDNLPAAVREERPDGILAAFDQALPFSLTTGQMQVGKDISADLASGHPMHRLLQGDVGSGKTVVALRAMLTVVDGGGQAALLAPTEVLATQHARSLAHMLGELAHAGQLGSPDQATSIALLTGSLNAAQRRATLQAISDGSAGIVVGTHALLQDGVSFKDLGLVVIDEQHRFGVEQRDALRAKGNGIPHLLVMTATPIPRTVAMTVFGDLATSELTELPAGRQDIHTHVVPAANTAWMQRVWQRVRDECDAGRQAFVVCPKVKPTDGEGGGASVEEVHAELSALPVLQGLRIGLLHGQLSSDEKDAAMNDFARGVNQVLVATTVIEVGVDVPNATVMVVMDADRFGVTQLHQLRGRIGRGSHSGVCLLVTSAEPESDAGQRLKAVAASTDGFELARFDLEQRREGDVLGVQQSGHRSSLTLLRVLRDADLLDQAREDATALIAHDPTLSQWPALAAAIDQALPQERERFLERS